MNLAALAAGLALIGQAPAAEAVYDPCTFILTEPMRVGSGPAPLVREVYLVFFESGTRFQAGAEVFLRNMARDYAPIPQCVVTIAAHTDRVGGAAANRRLSYRRAAAVASWLRRHGVRAQFTLEPFGESRPLVETEDGIAERQNRRAEIIVGPRRPRPQ